LLKDGKLIDEKLASWINAQFFLGVRPWRGQKAIAALQSLFPEFGKHGHKALPRAMRCMRGWTRLMPGQSKSPWPWPVWFSLAGHAASGGNLRMGMAILIAVAGYLRVTELLNLTVGQLMKPSSLGVSSWSLFLHPIEKQVVSKTGQSDEAVVLDAPEVAFLIPLLEELKKRGHTEARVPMTYLEYYWELRSIAVKLKLPTLPSETRHSGASLDRALERRSLAEMQRQGRWQSAKSVTRYVARASLSARQQKHFTECQRVAGDVFLRGRKFLMPEL
jgi:hypothetical protein